MKSNKRDITPKVTKISGSSTIMRKLGDGDGPTTPSGGGTDIADFKTPLAPHPIGSSYYQRISSAKAVSSDCTTVDTVIVSKVIVNDDGVGSGGDGNGFDEVGTKVQVGQPLVELIDNSDVHHEIVVSNLTTNAVLIHFLFLFFFFIILYVFVIFGSFIWKHTKLSL